MSPQHHRRESKSEEQKTYLILGVNLKTLVWLLCLVMVLLLANYLGMTRELNGKTKQNRIKQRTTTTTKHKQQRNKK